MPGSFFADITNAMRIPLLPRSVLLLTALCASLARAAGEPIDFNRARHLIERERAGETLPAAEKAYLERAMAEWAPPDAQPWRVARERLAAADVTPAQVQVAWIKLANKAPSGSLEEHGRKLERDTLAMLQQARVVFPNLRIAYLGSRTYGGYATGGLNPEPYSFESAFAARWLIQRQMNGDAALGGDKAPLLLWGPYLWADGPRGRKGDGLVWERSDFVADGVHPSESGRRKVAELLLDFLITDPLARPWFVR